MLTLRFDLRAPAFGATSQELAAAAVEMCSWADPRVPAMAVLSEHHATDDAHLSSPIVLAAAIVARTQRLPIMLAAVVLPFYEPIRLADEMRLLHTMSNGRVTYALAVGHRAEEYDVFGLPFAERGRLADDRLDVLLERLGDQRPRLMIAGGSRPAARRAARHGLGLLAQANPPGLKDFFEAESRAAGHEPGPAVFPTGDGPSVVFVADDPDAAWAELGPHLLHDAQTAAAYRHHVEGVASITTASTVEELRRSGVYAVLTPAEATAAGRLPLHPLCGGLHPDKAWPYLELAAKAVTIGAER